MTTRRTLLVSTLFLTLIAVSAFAQPARILNTNVASRNAGPDLRAEIAAAAPGGSSQWLAWSLPSIDPSYEMCCSNGDWSDESRRCCGVCRLDGESNRFITRDDQNPGSAPNFALFVRVTGGSVDRIRTFSPGCTIDAEGASVTWLNGVSPRATVTYLASAIGRDDDERHGWKDPVSTIAMIGDPSATDALEELTTATHSDVIRAKAVFWIASTRGRRGFEVARKLAGAPGSAHLREQAIFALSISKEPATVDALIAIAHNDRDADSRGKALFWLSQKAGKKASAALRDAAVNDPETKVKEQAVFGISQLPNDQSIPLLLDLVRSSRNAQVRKRAVFWLGQKNDPRALAAIEAILKN